MPTLLTALHNFNQAMNIVTDAQPNSLLNTPTKILWQQVWGLAALLAAITFSWIAYGFYQPQILARIGFVDLAIWLGIFQGLLGAIVEPVVGWFSDRVLGRFGSRLPQVVTGVTLAGLIFVIVSWLVEAQLAEQIRWIVPVMMTIWVIAMIIFRGPAIALLQGFAPTSQLPQANSVLALVLAITSATSPILGLILKQIGASTTFILGAIALLVGAVLLWASMPRYIATASEPEIKTSEKINEGSPKSLVMYALPFMIGLGSGLEINLLLHTLPHNLNKAIANLPIEYSQSILLLIAGQSTLPLRSILNRQKVAVGMLWGLVAIAVCLILNALSQNAAYLFVVGSIAAIALGLVLTNTIPLALAMVPRKQAGFGTGLYFGGNGLATSVFASLVVIQGEITPIYAALLSVFALAIAALCLRKFMVQQQEANK